MDTSRAVRADYGRDGFYAELAEAAMSVWEGWRHEGEPLFHPDGFLLLTRAPMRSGGFEHDSFQLLRDRGFPVVRLDGDAAARRFPVLAGAGFVDGYFNPRAGWVDAAQAVAMLAARARTAGVDVRECAAFSSLIEHGSRVAGVRFADGEEHAADIVVMAVGAWTPELLPQLSDRIRAVAQPVFYYEAPNADRFRTPHFAPFGADIARTGWYGFPATADGVVKVANHGPGMARSPSAGREVPSGAEAGARAFLAETLPELARAPLAAAKLCFYCDTFDGDFWIDRDPSREGLVVATGGSGHGFKFAPVLGEIIADVVEGVRNARGDRFRWRELGPARAEAARSSGCPR